MSSRSSDLRTSRHGCKENTSPPPLTYWMLTPNTARFLSVGNETDVALFVVLSPYPCPEGGLCAEWQVSWLLPGNASSQSAFPSDILVRCTQKAITVAGTAPVLHRIPSLPDPLHRRAGITICAAKL